MPGCPGLGLKDEMNNSGFVQGVLGFAWTDDPIVRSKWFRWVPRGFHRTDRREDRFPQIGRRDEQLRLRPGCTWICLDRRSHCPVQVVSLGSTWIPSY